LAGCSSPPATAEADAKGKPDRKADGDDAERRPLRDLKARREARKAAKAELAPDDGETPEGERPDPAVPAPVEGATPPANPHVEEPMIGYPGDPPYIDGYNPEEATCVSGNWCGTKQTASAVAVPNVGEALGCAARITGGNKTTEAITADPKAYAGLSAAPAMQGAFNQHGTELARAKAGGDDACCYHWFEYCSGRPLLGDHGPVVADVRPGAAWSRPVLAGVEPTALAEELRHRIAQGFLDDALAEHASVAAFARATLELMAVGAPPGLLEQAQRAALDEIGHARLCFVLAAHHGGAAVEPGPLPVPAPRPASLPQLAADAFAEGCVGETIAALAAQRAARSVVDPAARDALAGLADDEARHAALAWSTVAWALEQGGAAVAERLRRAAAALRPSPALSQPPADPHAAELAAHGRLDARAHALASHQAWEEIIDPMLSQLLAAAAS
jgi:hypothetical protein